MQYIYKHIYIRIYGFPRMWFPKVIDGLHLRIHCLDWIDATSPPGDFRDRGDGIGIAWCWENKPGT